MEFISPEGLRMDGRPPTALREMACSLNVYDSPNGSAYLEMGNTKVLASVYGPREIHNSKQVMNEVAIQCEVSRIAACQEERLKRPRDQRTRAMSQQIASCCKAVIRKTKYPGSQIDVYVQIVQQDGGLLAACINVTTLALIHAGVELFDHMSACTASIYGDEPLLDVCYAESQACELTLALMPNRGTIVSLHTSNSIHKSNFEKVLDLATVGCHSVYQEMHRQVEEFLKEKHAVMAYR